MDKNTRKISVYLKLILFLKSFSMGGVREKQRGQGEAARAGREKEANVFPLLLRLSSSFSSPTLVFIRRSAPSLPVS